jgi:Do/DeqQ family serine protease
MLPAVRGLVSDADGGDERDVRQMKTMRNHAHSHIWIVLFSLALGALMGGLYLAWPSGQPAEAQERNVVTAPASLSGLEGAFVQIAEQALPAVVNISAERITVSRGQDIRKELWKFFPHFGFPEPDEEEEQEMPEFHQRARSLGSGFFYDDQGHIITNRHVIRDAEDIKVKLVNIDGRSDKSYPAKMIGSDARTELALIKIEPDFRVPTLSLADSDEVKIGQWAIAVGNPFELNGTFTVGVVSARGRAIPGESEHITVRDLIQTDAAINPGNSGGPLLNLRGEVIGINVAIKTTGLVPANAGIGFAIPSNDAREIVPELREHGVVQRGWLGVKIKNLTEELKDYFGVTHGVLVEEVTEDAPASKAQPTPVQVEDVITEFNGEKVEDSLGLQNLVGREKPGTDVKLDIVRGGKKMELTVKLAELPAMYAAGEDIRPDKAEVIEALGIKVAQIDEAIKRRRPRITRDEGVVVTNVDPASDAITKVAKDDVILKVNDKEINTIAEYEAAIKEDTGRDYVVMRVERKERDGEVSATTITVKRPKQ